MIQFIFDVVIAVVVAFPYAKLVFDKLVPKQVVKEVVVQKVDILAPVVDKLENK